MKPFLRFITAAGLIILPATAFAQVDPHHPDAGAAAPPAPAATPSATPAPGPMPGGQPGQSAAMMQMMQQMMPMMQQMMQMMQGGMMGGQMGGMSSQGGMMGMGGMPMPGGMSEASKAFMEAMTKMDAPMMTALQTADPDVAFVSAMIPHHQGAIDMARAVLTHGKDEKVKAWAEEIIKAQEAEIAEMQAWLKERQK